MKFNAIPFVILCVFIALGGCTLDSPPDLGARCDEVSFVWPNESMDEIRIGANETYDYYLNHKVCPPEHPMCLQLHGVVYRGMIDENGDYLGDIVLPDEWYCSDRRESCPKNSHLVLDGMYCERDSARHCGSDENNCMDSAKGVDSAECVNGQCQVLKCLQGFALIDGECRTGAQCCGDYCKNCTLAQPRQVCTTEDSLSFDCGAGCALHNMIDCMGVCINPDTSLTFCGADEAEDGMCKMHYCPDMEGWRNGSCIKGVCQVSECILGYHIAADANNVKHCEPDSAEVCGTKFADCTQIANAENVSCERGICTIKQCKNGFTLYDNECIEFAGEPCGEIVCGPHSHCDRATQRCMCDSDYNDCSGVCYDLKRSAYHCGSCSNICTSDKFSHSTELACENGACGIAACEDGYYPEDSRCMSNKCENGTTDCIHTDKIGQVRTCVNGVWSEPYSCDNYSCNNDIENCGVCINGSTKCESNLHFTCINGRWQNVKMCEAPQICAPEGCVSCGAGEHVYNGSCEKNDVNNCGSHDTRCDATVRPGGSAFSCDTGTCVATSCASGYHKNGDGCERNDVNNCGSHGTRCDSSVRPGGSAFSCDTGTCVATACASGYHKYGDGCERNDLNNCGSHGTRCDSSVRPGGTAFNCNSGSCVATACSGNYHSYDNGCEENTTKNCGKHGNTCDSRSHASASCNSGSCKYSCNSGYGDCDDNMNNGCEVNFSDHALKNCTTCATDFDECGKSKDVEGAPFCINRHYYPTGYTYISDEWCYGYCNNSGESIYPGINYKQCKPGQKCYLKGSTVYCQD